MNERERKIQPFGLSASLEAHTTIDLARELARRTFLREFTVDPFGQIALFTRFSALLYSLRIHYRHETAESRLILRREASDLLEILKGSGDDESGIGEYLRETVEDLSTDEGSHPIVRYGWQDISISPETLSLPTMHGPADLQYFKWLGMGAKGQGEIVELGCWLGSSTRSVAEGLVNGAFADSGHRMHAYDSFLWEKWMEAYRNERLRTERTLEFYETFQDIFMSFCKPYEEIILPHCNYFPSKEDPGDLMPLAWAGEAIEIYIYGMGSDKIMLEESWRIFESGFRTGLTLCVFVEYGGTRGEQIRQFCRSHSDQLSVAHKPASAIKTYQYVAS
jgi:hypothetical protein